MRSFSILFLAALATALPIQPRNADRQLVVPTVTPSPGELWGPCNPDGGCNSHQDQELLCSKYVPSEFPDGICIPDLFRTTKLLNRLRLWWFDSKRET
ncbi:hypothetical protein H072_1851 [Dactylellina haptotyla CBS 200.50]|uniref:Uncharacterized protein n=1 Tax=Dactylellina haptotyla (strain CBS 200.50) TaxID=1284197 RepID=S8BX92_DACHA|nr:hypothetical protein H072_1851 [Dactylellina haptotyla CBS 200.50]